jgi:tRNA-splicing endonuclease subunit Sen2
MGKRSHKRNLNQLYGRPLPLLTSSEVYGDLPQLFPHNPLSLILFTYKMLQINYVKSVPKLDKIFVAFEEGVFRASDEESINLLWSNGFFGKGVLSRSEPTWKQRTTQRLNLGASSQGVSIEQVTNLRREERNQFKAQRSKLQGLELKARQQLCSPEEIVEMELLRKQVDELRNKTADFSGSKKILIREEDLQIIDENNEVINIEFLQLQAVEVFFLKFALNVIEIDFNLRQLFQLCIGDDMSRDNKFILDYVVYHHYRSLGWCVRSGIKFGCDMLLYKRGPPFSHAEYSVMIVQDGKNYDWLQLTTLARVIGTVKKNLVFVFVSSPTQIEFERILNRQTFTDEKELFEKLFKLYKVTEVLYRRWAPSRTRD